MLSEDIRGLAAQILWMEQQGLRLPASYLERALDAYADRAAALECQAIPGRARLQSDIEVASDGKVISLGTRRGRG